MYGSDSMRRFTTTVLVFLAATALADPGDEIFQPDDHCVAYRTVKDILFAVDTEIIGRSCEVTASLVTGEAGPQVVVTVPVKSFKSGNVLRNLKVSQLLGADVQPDLRFTSEPLDVDALRHEVPERSFVLAGTLTMGGRDFPLEFPLEIVQHEGRHYVKGSLPTTFEAFDVQVPTVAGGLIARPHEELELVVHLELERVEGLEAWARAAGLR